MHIILVVIINNIKNPTTGYFLFPRLQVYSRPSLGGSRTGRKAFCCNSAGGVRPDEKCVVLVKSYVAILEEHSVASVDITSHYIATIHHLGDILITELNQIITEDIGIAVSIIQPAEKHPSHIGTGIIRNYR
ncbi:MAG: hypothetical protein DRI48_10815 [Chloroflexi bacterium]|nr:MAG: hypothetical protein DRI48_10815 [Chloroflexota bacterium]